MTSITTASRPSASSFQMGTADETRLFVVRVSIEQQLGVSISSIVVVGEAPALWGTHDGVAVGDEEEGAGADGRVGGGGRGGGGSS